MIPVKQRNFKFNSTFQPLFQFLVQILRYISTHLHNPQKDLRRIPAYRLYKLKEYEHVSFVA